MHDSGDCVQSLLYGFVLGDALGWEMRDFAPEEHRQHYREAKLGNLLSMISDLPTPRLAQLSVHPDQASEILFDVRGVDVLGRLACNKVPPERFLPELVTYFTDDFEYERALLRVEHVMGWGSEERALKHLGRGASDPEILAMAIYCILRCPTSLDAALICAACTEGQSHKIAAIVGMVMATIQGLDESLVYWIDALPAMKSLSEPLPDIYDRLRQHMG